MITDLFRCPGISVFVTAGLCNGGFAVNQQLVSDNSMKIANYRPIYPAYCNQLTDGGVAGGMRIYLNLCLEWRKNIFLAGHWIC